MELRTQRVWDYVRDGFVHRLIQSKTGLVELTRRRRGDATDASLAATSASFSGASLSASVSKRRDGGAGPTPGSLDHGLGAEYDDEYPMDPGLEEALVSSKLDAIHAEYSALLASQLDSQRRYFEGLVAAAAAEKEGALSAAAAAEKQAEVIAGAVRDAREARQELKATRAERDVQRSAVEALEKENAFLRSVNDALTLNQSSLQREKDEAAEGSSSSAREKDERIRDLEEQVRDLMVFLDAREKVAAEAVAAGTGNGSEEGPSESIRGGSVLGVANPAVPGADDAPSRSGTHARLQKKLAARQNKRGG
jgi:BRCA1-associated protein